jgi:hypothetical protein
MTKLIFLDVDGVLNNQIHYQSDYFQKNRDNEDHDLYITERLKNGESCSDILNPKNEKK